MSRGTPFNSSGVGEGDGVGLGVGVSAGVGVGVVVAVSAGIGVSVGGVVGVTLGTRDGRAGERVVSARSEGSFVAAGAAVSAQATSRNAQAMRMKAYGFTPPARSRFLTQMTWSRFSFKCLKKRNPSI